MQFTTALIAVTAALLATAEARPQPYGHPKPTGCKPRPHPYTPAPNPNPYDPINPPAPNPNPYDNNAEKFGLLIECQDDASLDKKYVTSSHAGAGFRLATVTDDADLNFGYRGSQGLYLLQGEVPNMFAAFPKPDGVGVTVSPFTFGPGDRGERTHGVGLDKNGYLTLDGKQEWYACPSSNLSRDPGLGDNYQIGTSAKLGLELGVPSCKKIQLRKIQKHVV